MIDRDTFGRLVQDALSHLYDHSYLQTHPLANLFAIEGASETHGQGLRRILLEAIQQIAPPPATPFQSPVWRKHRYLILRYLEDRTATEVTEDLAISERHSRRYHHEAIEALSSILWDRLQNDGRQPPSTNRSAKPDNASPRNSPASREPAVLEDELAALEAGESRGPVSIGTTVDGVFSTVAPLAESRQIALTLHAAGNLPAARISRSVLRPIILEVLLTALDLPNAEAISVDVSANAQAITVSFTVRRRAAGSASTPANRGATEPLIAHPDRLEVARRLLLAHGGRISVGDALNQPTTIQVVLPSVSPATILVVDDNHDARQLARRCLTGGNYSVLEAASGEEALTIALREKPSVITLDAMMPNQDGWETLQVLRSHPATRAIPVVVCSVLHERELALSLGAADYLIKPVSRQDFLAAIGRCLALASSEDHRSLSEGPPSAPPTKGRAPESPRSRPRQSLRFLLPSP